MITAESIVKTCIESNEVLERMNANENNPGDYLRRAGEIRVNNLKIGLLENSETEVRQLEENSISQ